MADAAKRFVDSLHPWQRGEALFTFEGDERYFWHYTPVERNGLLLINMTPAQQELAFALMATGLSERGYRQARQIIALETMLRLEEHVERPGMERWDRNPLRYYFSVFGQPGGKAPWAWRVGGHHIGFHFTLVDGDLISPLPLFFGANPSQVKYGPETGLRALPDEEDLARQLVQSLSAEQASAAIVDPVAPDDLLTKNYRKVGPEMTAAGVSFGALGGGQRDVLVKLLRLYVERATDELSANEWARIEGAGLDRVTFAWAGPTEKGFGKGHYYNVKGPTFMLEYDNTQNDSNHIHSVWRDFTNDFAEDLLAGHLSSVKH